MYLENKEVFVYGTGSYSEKLKVELVKRNIEIKGYLDSNKSKFYHSGKRVYSVEELILKERESYFIIVGSSFYNEVSKVLSNYHLVEYKDYCSGDFFIPDFYSKVSYSQYAEDLLIESVLTEYIGFTDTGYFIDIGAYHPYKFSNTYKFYLNGWRGINIEPTPNKIELFNILRPGDININVGVSSKETSMDFYIYSENAYNTNDIDLVRERISNKNLHYIEKRMVNFLTLQNIVDTYMGEKKFNLLNIDVEGHEMDVLNSYNWSFKPYIIAIEMFNIEKSDVKDFLEAKNYRLMAKSVATGIFVLEELIR